MKANLDSPAFLAARSRCRISIFSRGREREREREKGDGSRRPDDSGQDLQPPSNLALSASLIPFQRIPFPAGNSLSLPCLSLSLCPFLSLDKRYCRRGFPGESHFGSPRQGDVDLAVSIPGLDFQEMETFGLSEDDALETDVSKWLKLRVDSVCNF